MVQHMTPANSTLRCGIVVLQHRGEFANPGVASNIHMKYRLYSVFKKNDNPAPNSQIACPSTHQATLAQVDNQSLQILSCHDINMQC